MFLKKFLSIVFIAFFAANLAASSVLELVGAQDSVHPFTSRIISTGAEAAYFNPADLATLDDSFKIGFGMTIQNKSISHKARPDGYDVTEHMHYVNINDAEAGIYSPLPTSELINKRGSADYDSFDGVIMLGAVKNIAKKSLEKLGGQLTVGVYALLPISGIQTQEPFFNDEREQYFSNSVQFELYGDRLKQFSAAAAIAGRFGRYFRIGAGIAISTYTKTQNRVFVPNTTDPSLQLINAKMNVGASVMPYFSFVANPVAGWHLTGTFHFPTNTGIVKLNNEMQVNGWDYEENQRWLTAESSMTAGYQPIKLSIGTYYDFKVKDYTITPMASFEWSRWSTYVNRHGEKPIDKWDDTFSTTAGLIMRHPERRAAFGFNYVPSPVPAQTGRENYVDNDRFGFSLGYHEYFGITDQVKIGAGISGSLQWLLSRTETKDEERDQKDGGLIDEMPDDAEYNGPNGSGQRAEFEELRKGLQTNNPGFPGWTSKGFLLNIGISAEVIW